MGGHGRADRARACRARQAKIVQRDTFGVPEHNRNGG